MYTRTILVILIAAAVVLLLVLAMEAAGMRRSLRRIEREERRPVVERTFPKPKTAPPGGWVLMAPPPDNVYAPLAQWTLVPVFTKPFDTEAQCLVARNSLGRRGGALGMPTPAYQNPRCIALVAPMPPGGPMEDMSLPFNRGIPWTPLPNEAEIEAETKQLTNLVQSPDFAKDFEARLKALGLDWVSYGPYYVWPHKKPDVGLPDPEYSGKVVLGVGVTNKVTPELRARFAQAMQGVGHGYPVALYHEEQAHFGVGQHFSSNS